MFEQAAHNIVYIVNLDYPLSGVMTNFEVYMFVTKDRFIEEHRMLEGGRLDGRIYVVDGESRIVSNRQNSILGSEAGSFCVEYPDVDRRSYLMRFFNAVGSRKGLGNPSSKRYSCAMVDLEDTLRMYRAADYVPSAHALCDVFLKWCLDNHRVGACVEHLEQGSRYPHVHFLYERGNRQHEEFQKWLAVRLDKEHMRLNQ